MSVRNTLIKTFSLSLLLVAYTPAMADEILVTNCSGDTRAIYNLPTGTTGQTVEGNIVDSNGTPVEGEIATLTNVETGKALTATASNGVLTYSNVSPGKWKLCTAGNLTLVDVSIGAGESKMGSLAKVGALAGVAGIGAALANSGSSGSTTESISQIIVESNNNITAAAVPPSNIKKDRGHGVRAQANEECLSDVEPVPVSPSS